MAEEYRKKGACDRAVPLYKWALATTDTAMGFALGPYARCLLQLGQLDAAHAQAMRGVARGEEVRSYRRLLHEVDSIRTVVRRGGPVGPMPSAYPAAPRAAMQKTGVVRHPSQNAGVATRVRSARPNGK